MKGLVVFYSLEEHTKFIADMIAEELKCELLELKPVEEYPKNGIKKYWFGGMGALFKKQPALKNKIQDLSEYDTIFIGTPVWAGTYAPPINTFISKNKIDHKNLAFFACHGGGGAQKCFEKLEAALKDNTILGKIEFADSSTESEKRDKLKEWIRKIIN
ncbi:flavodoxin [Clostridium sp. BL-8]|uniref:flavodoxin family protein n=1 Tax=Clostridium sp. BL-8 TaxID=349938 RepID=UPI00098C8C7B|nr:flavodoxin [Clostridium sp. BL-8]OOM81307.1 flavodoxin [Clostridium sp. BL-8]